MMTVRWASLAGTLALASAGACATRAPSTPAAPMTNDLYLLPTETGGGKLCFNPESRRLRAILASPPPKAEDPVDARALAEDLSFLHDVMRTQYAGYSDLVQRDDFDLPQFFEQWRRDLASAGPTVTFDRGVLDPLRKLRAVRPDNHHYVGTPGGWGPRLRDEPQSIVREYQAVVPSADAMGALDACQVETTGTPLRYTLRTAPLVRPDRTESLVTVSIRAGGERAALRCPKASFELTPRPLTPKLAKPGPNEELYTWRTVGDTAIITVRALAGTSAQMKQVALLARDYAAQRRLARIVFDFRGNGGGNDRPVYEWISKAKKGTWPSGAGLVLQGALTPCSMWNVMVFQQAREHAADSAESRAEREKERSHWPKGPNHPRWVYDSGFVEDHADDPYTGQVYVLVDRNSGSSGEGGPMALKYALGAKIVGERSAGLWEYGEIRPYVLPRSGVIWWLATTRFLTEPPAETVGITVDAYLPDVSLPIERIVPLLTEERLPKVR